MLKKKQYLKDASGLYLRKFLENRT